MSRPSKGRMLRNEQQPMLELNLGDPLYHVTCVVASVHLNLDSDPIYGCTDEPPTLVLGWTLSITIVDHIYSLSDRNQHTKQPRTQTRALKFLTILFFTL